MPIERPTFRFIALHHHLLPVGEVEAPASDGVTLALDASVILAEAQAAGVHVALHGHQHKAKLASYIESSAFRSDLWQPDPCRLERQRRCGSQAFAAWREQLLLRV